MLEIHPIVVKTFQSVLNVQLLNEGGELINVFIHRYMGVPFGCFRPRILHFLFYVTKIKLYTDKKLSLDVNTEETYKKGEQTLWRLNVFQCSH